jgi:hypothetical protein
LPRRWYFGRSKSTTARQLLGRDECHVPECLLEIVHDDAQPLVELDVSEGGISCQLSQSLHSGVAADRRRS